MKPGWLYLIWSPFIDDPERGKTRPVVCIGKSPDSNYLYFCPISSQVDHLIPGDVILENWKESGMTCTSLVRTVVVSTLCPDYVRIRKKIGELSSKDLASVLTTARQHGFLGVNEDSPEHAWDTFSQGM